MKTCNICNKEKDFSEFTKLKSMKDGHMHQCKPCRSKKQKKVNVKRKNRAVKHYGGACQHCGGIFHDAVYEFHHINESTKEHEPHRLIQTTEDFEIVKKELDKCLILCANCHRMEHVRLNNMGGEE